MTEHVRPQALSAAGLAELIERVDTDTARKILEIIGRDRILVGCGGVYRGQEAVAGS